LGVSFAIWGLAVIPAWFVVRQIGIEHFGPEKSAVKHTAASLEDRKRDSE
jgi:hypothetical protein